MHIDLTPPFQKGDFIVSDDGAELNPLKRAASRPTPRERLGARVIYAPSTPQLDVRQGHPVWTWGVPDGHPFDIMPVEMFRRATLLEMMAEVECLNADMKAALTKRDLLLAVVRNLMDQMR